MKAGVPTAVWRNGSASDSRSEGWEFESLCGHFFAQSEATVALAWCNATISAYTGLHCKGSTGNLQLSDGESLTCSLELRIFRITNANSTASRVRKHANLRIERISHTINNTPSQDRTGDLQRVRLTS